ncbi:MAG: non-hydrolyzing UDP-N-acetylglucosamine 2-epimerase [bacterium]
MKIISVVGARPQFIKATIVSQAIEKHNVSSSHRIEEILLHTGQHYDYEMSEIFFQQLKLKKPDYNLEVGSDTHAKQTARMLERIEEVLFKEKPDLVLVYGDTNSTLAGALAASKLNIKVAHIEAGIREFNKAMPEEQNRILTDHLSSLLFCPTQTAVKNLKREGIEEGVFFVGDVMFDAILGSLPIAELNSRILKDLALEPKNYYLTTIHRAENTDRKENLHNLLFALNQLELPVVFPIHPRTKKAVERYGLSDLLRKLKVIEPVGYLDMLVLERNARAILTDSGGVQKEAYLLGVPCITLRNETGWVETLEGGWNVLAGTDVEKILEYARKSPPTSPRRDYFGDGRAGERIVEIISSL